MKKIFFLLAFLFSTSAFAGLDFHWSPSKEWENQLLQSEKEIYAFLGEEFSYPQDPVRVAYMPEKEVVYSISKKAIMMGEFHPILFQHEYTHALFDDYLFRKSPGWFYFRIKTYLKDADLKASIEQKKKDLKKYRETLQEFIEMDLEERYIENIKKTIASTEENIGFFKRALKTEETYLKPHENLEVDKLIRPYHELLADALPVLMSENWRAVKEASERSLQRSGSRLLVPDGATVEQVLGHRVFRRLGPLETHRFQQWEEESSYTQFAPVRSYLRKASYDHDNGRIVRVLFDVFTQEFEQILKNQDLWSMGLKEKNRRLIQKLQKRL